MHSWKQAPSQLSQQNNVRWSSYIYKNQTCTSLIIFLHSGAEALEASIAAVCKYGGASAGYRTLLDALIPASTMLQEVINNDHYLSVFIVNVALCDLTYLSSLTEVKCWGWSLHCFCPLIWSSIGWSWVNQAHAGTGDIHICSFPYFVGDFASFL